MARRGQKPAEQDSGWMGGARDGVEDGTGADRSGGEGREGGMGSSGVGGGGEKELINPWISTQKAKTQNSIQYIITRVRQLEHLLIITRKQQKEPAGHAFGNAALCRPPTLRNGKASEPSRRSSDHGSQILNRGLSLFRIMVPPPSQVFCRSR